MYNCWYCLNQNKCAYKLPVNGEIGEIAACQKIRKKK